MTRQYDVAVVGAGPNGLSAAITAARHGLSVIVLEANSTIGGGARSAELTLPGFIHDVCSAVHPMGAGSPFLRDLPLHDHGLEWITPPVAFAHPQDDGSAVAVFNSLEETIEKLGGDGRSYKDTIGYVCHKWEKIEKDIMGPLGLPSHPFTMARFGLGALLPADRYARRHFKSVGMRALFAGAAAHSIIPLERIGSASFGIVLAAVAHVYGWPIPRGGSQVISDALAGYLLSLGGEIAVDRQVNSMDDLPSSRAVLFDTSPRALERIAGDRLSDRYRKSLRRFRYGPGVFKVDWALDGPIPWLAYECTDASTVHVGGTLEEIAEAERLPWEGKCAERPFALVTQPSLFDPTRTPEGKHTAWAYCHVPNGSREDMTSRLEAQIERFAPGFRDLILARSSHGPADLELHNANMIGGDIGGGANLISQFFLRPTRKTYSTGTRGIYLCSASTPPGGGVHGMCGYNAARRAIKEVFGSVKS